MFNIALSQVESLDFSIFNQDLTQHLRFLVPDLDAN